MRHSVLSLFLGLAIYFLSTGYGHAQCEIVADSTGCLDEPVRFRFTPSGATIIKWEFGDGTSSTQSSPVHKYNSTGSHTVTVQVRMPDNSTCSGTHRINIHAPPEPNMVIDPASEFCLSKNKLCLIDSARTGPTNTRITKRIILWGDGASRSSTDPVTGEKSCYTYKRTDDYKITVEWTNRVGCAAIQELDVQIKPDYIPSFTFASSALDCGKLIACFENDSIVQHTDLVDFDWDFGFGFTDTVPWNGSCFTYDSSGTYTVTFRTTHKNGCVNESSQKIKVFIPEFDFDVQTGDSFACFPSDFYYTQTEIPGMMYHWKLYNSALKLVDSFGFDNSAVITPPGPGKFIVSLTLSTGDCEREEYVDTIITAGVLADFKLFNGSQCTNKDTVFACNQTLKYGTDSVIYFWNFGDPDPDTRCTTDLYNGINLDMNCNYVWGEDARHKYTDEGCPSVRLIARDLENGCADTTTSTAIINNPDSLDLYYSVDRKCIGLESPYQFAFTESECAGDLLINYDSACGKDLFTVFNPLHYYQGTCDSSGWVTVGIIAKVGSKKVYRSCDTSDYYIDTSRLCYDTLWKSHWFRLNKEPDAKFTYEQEDCVPAKVTVRTLKRVQPGVARMVFNWGDGEVSTIPVNGLDSLPVVSHSFQKAGSYSFTLYLETDSGCYNTQSASLKIGYFNTFFMDTVVCPGQKVQIVDQLYYWDDNRPHWRDPQRAKDSLEMLVWDFGDGNGFSTTGPLPVISYPKEGRYLIRMASKDQYGCRDTARKYITVTGVVANIANKDKELICNDIIQFFDSSYMPGGYDSIENWHWDFGDGRTPSYLQDPYHYYSSFGTFVLRLIVETYSGCLDTAYYPIEINGPKPYFEIVSDTVGCVPFTAEFNNLSEDVSDYIWYFGDDQNSTLSTQSDTNVSFTYTKPGIYYIYLWGSDSLVNEDNNNAIYFCKATFPDSNAIDQPVRRVVVLPVPQAGFVMDSVACTSGPVWFTDLSDSIYDTYRWFISNGDSVISTEPGAGYHFDSAGTYIVSYYPRYVPEGPYQRACYDSVSQPVNIYELEAGMELVKDPYCPDYIFRNTSSHTTDAVWDLGPSVSGKRYHTGKEISYNFTHDSGIHKICLFVTDGNACRDTTCDTIEVNYRFNVFIPNIFTPQNDGYNDDYEIDIYNEGIYDLKVYNRWGEMVYRQSEDADAGTGLNWDGTYMNSGDECPEGTYFYIFTFSNRCIGKPRTIEGIITLLR